MSPLIITDELKADLQALIDSLGLKDQVVNYNEFMEFYMNHPLDLE